MTTVRNRDIAVMTDEAMDNRLKELQDELLMLRAEQALGGSPSNPGEIRAAAKHRTTEDAHEDEAHELKE